MKAFILQLSDFHFTARDTHLKDRAKAVQASIRALDPDIELIIVALTGDISNTGSSEDFKQATQFFNFLKSELESLPKRPTVAVVAIPGNHDCVLNENDIIRETLIEKVLSTQNYEPQFVDALTAAQANFFEFINNESKNWGISLNISNKLHWTVPIVHAGKQFNLRCYNTAWMSQRNEKQANIVFPENLTEEVVDSYINIALLHHPFNWIQADNAKAFQTEIELNHDLVLSGHEHIANSYVKTALDSSKQIYMDSGAFHERTNPTESTFTGLLLNLSEEVYQRHHFTLKQDFYERSELGGWEEYLRNRSLTKNKFLLNKKFIEFLSSPGASFSHPRVHNLSLQQIFIFPDLQDLNSEKDGSDKDVIDASAMIDLLTKNEKTAVIAPEQAGKTALCKAIYSKTHENNLLPLYLTGDELQKVHLKWDQLEKLLKKKFLEQYDNSDWLKYVSYGIETRILLIDDFDHCELNQEGREKIYQLLDNFFGSTLILVDDVFQIEEFASGSTFLDSFQRFKMLEFGHAKRDEIIERWMMLGLEFTAEPVDIERKRAQAETVLQNALLKKLLPSFPIFILICLQQLEFNRVSDNAGSYGYLFDSLIRDSLIKATYSNFDLDALFTYLTEFANEVRENREMTAEQLHDFHERHRTEYGVSISEEIIISKLLTAGVLTTDQNTYKFKYKYFYLYFYARFLSKILGNIEVKEQVKELIKNIQKEDNANILMFLSFFTTDPSIIDAIISEAKNIFSNLSPCNFEDVSKSFLGLDVSTVDTYLDLPTDMRVARKEALQLQDRKKRMTGAERGLDSILEINRASKTIQVLGQILRSYPGSLKRDRKTELASACYALGMRSLSYVYSIVTEHQDYMLQTLVLRLELDIKSQSRDELRAAARKIYFSINQSLAGGFIFRVSRSLGTEKLQLIFTDIKKNEQSISTELIDIAIKLEHFSNFPETEIKVLVKKYKDNPFTLGVLKLLVRNYLFLFPSDYLTRQKVSAIFNISMDSMRTNDLKNTSRKLIEAKKKS